MVMLLMTVFYTLLRSCYYGLTPITINIIITNININIITTGSQKSSEASSPLPPIEVQIGTVDGISGTVHRQCDGYHGHNSGCDDDELIMMVMVMMVDDDDTFDDNDVDSVVIDDDSVVCLYLPL